MTRDRPLMAAPALGAALGGGGAMLGALITAAGGGWAGAALAAAAMALAGWRAGGAGARRNTAARGAKPDAAPEPVGLEEPRTESERRADRDWRRVATSPARNGSADRDSQAVAGRDEDWLEL